MANTPKDGAAAVQQPAPAQQPTTQTTPQQPVAPTAAPAQPVAPQQPAQGAAPQMQMMMQPQMMMGYGYGYGLPQMQFAPQATAAPAQPAAPATPAQLSADQAGVLEENIKKMIEDYEKSTGKKFSYGADDSERSWFEEHYILTAAGAALLFCAAGYGLHALVSRGSVKKQTAEAYSRGFDAGVLSRSDKNMKAAATTAPGSPAAQNRGPANN